MPGRIILLVTSPRLPAGLLTAEAWDLVRTHPVLTGGESEAVTALRAAGARVSTVTTDAGPSAVVAALLAAAADGTVCWLAGPTGDGDVARALGLRLAREPGLAEMELVYGSWDPPGARLLDAVAVIDRLASPGGDPWKRQQTHASLAQYLLEECYEAYDAIAAGDLTALREELGDLLLQVLLHARMASEAEHWSVDEVAGDLVAKMIRRNPHVFGGAEVTDLDEITENWERIKQSEKVRGSVLDGVPLAQPALALAAKVLARAERVAGVAPPPSAVVAVTDAAALGEALFGVVAAARAAGLDAEAALRRAVLAYAEVIRATESPQSP